MGGGGGGARVGGGAARGGGGEAASGGSRGARREAGGGERAGAHVSEAGDLKTSGLEMTKRMFFDFFTVTRITPDTGFIPSFCIALRDFFSERDCFARAASPSPSAFSRSGMSSSESSESSPSESSSTVGSSSSLSPGIAHATGLWNTCAGAAQGGGSGDGERRAMGQASGRAVRQRARRAAHRRRGAAGTAQAGAGREAVRAAMHKSLWRRGSHRFATKIARCGLNLHVFVAGSPFPYLHPRGVAVICADSADSHKKFCAATCLRNTPNLHGRAHRRRAGWSDAGGRSALVGRGEPAERRAHEHDRRRHVRLHVMPHRRSPATPPARPPARARAPERAAERVTRSPPPTAMARLRPSPSDCRRTRRTRRRAALRRPRAAVGRRRGVRAPPSLVVSSASL